MDEKTIEEEKLALKNSYSEQNDPVDMCKVMKSLARDSLVGNKHKTGGISKFNGPGTEVKLLEMWDVDEDFANENI